MSSPQRQVFDADSHYYEPPDCISRYFPVGEQDRAFRRVDDGGQVRYLAAGREYTFLADPFHERATPRPGALREMLRDKSALRMAYGETEPAFVERDARLRVLDAEGVQAALVLPTVGMTIEHFFRGDPDLIYPNLHAFNRWLLDDWGYGADGRIIGGPLLSLADPQRAVTELDWLLGEGARVIVLRPGPAYGRSPADPVFDGVWARLEEAGVIAAFHIAESGYNERYAVDWGEAPNPSSHLQSALQWTLFFGDRPIMDTLAALVLHNLFGRFPNLRVASIENGSAWVGYLLKTMDKMKGMGRNGPWIGGPLTDRPSRLFKEHVFVVPYHEDDVAGLCDLIGSERVLFGSDWPHPEGVAHVRDWDAVVETLDPAARRRVMGENLAELLHLTPVG